MKQIASLLGLLVVIHLVFQNCSNTTLGTAVTDHVTVSKSQLNFCLDTLYPNYTVDSFYTANLNMVNRQNDMKLDSNSSGMSDSEKSQYGFKLSDRHSTGLLDIICFRLSGGSSCAQYIPAGCSNSTVNAFGLTDCDVKALQLSPLGQSQFGLDSDKDGIPDLIEILKGTNPAIDDALNDPDNDGVLNFQEIQSNTNPVYANSNFSPQLFIQAGIQKISTTGAGANCSENWQMNVAQMPLFQIPAYAAPMSFVANPSQINFYHDLDENVILATIRLKPNPGPGAKAPYIFLFAYYKVKFGSAKIQMNFSDFQEAGSVLQ